LIGDSDTASLKKTIMGSGMSVSDLAFTAFSAAETYRDSDKRGGVNGARLALAPQKDWTVNRRTISVIEKLQSVMTEFNNQHSSGKQVSLADLIVLGGCAAVEKAAKDAGIEAPVPFTPGRVDTTQDLTDEESFEWLKPVVDGFRNFIADDFADISQGVAPEEMFLDKANLMKLTAPEWTVLTGGLRVLGLNYDGSAHGVFTDRVGMLTNDFFVNLADVDLVWEKMDNTAMEFTLNDRKTGMAKFTATRNDLVFGTNAQLRSVVDVYASSDGHARFVKDFVKVWNKIMMLDRYDVKGHKRYGQMPS
jgi:catalase-peroxidase